MNFQQKAYCEYIKKNNMKIGIIDYGMGNLHSVKNAFEYIGCETIVSADSHELDRADGVILPGVGAFPDAMKFLKKAKMDEYVKYIASKKPLLGICLGMQLLFDRSYEFCECEGLGLVEGEVVKIEHTGVKIPHMGWNEITVINESPLLKGIESGAQVYFVHSYKAVVQNRQNLIATTDYAGEITAIVGKENVFGCQFHPEKSGEVGLKILENFKEICG